MKKLHDLVRGASGAIQNPSKNLSDCGALPWLIFPTVRNEEVAVRSQSPPPNYFVLRKPDAPSYETGRVGLCFSEFRKAWDSRAVGSRFHSEAQGKRSSPAAVLLHGEQDAR